MNYTLFGMWFCALASLAYGADDLSEFFNLHDKLPQAVCDESVIGRAPTLEAIRENYKGELRLELKYGLTESRAISFMLGDSLSLVAAPELESRLRSITSAGITELRRSVALEICTALVTKGKLKKLITSEPSLFMQASEASANAGAPGGLLMTITFRDRDSRFARLKGRKWLVPGWVESKEVESVRIGIRRYRRIVHPITLRTNFIEVSGESGIPLGFLYLSGDATVRDWQTLIEQSLSEANRERQADFYRLMIESEAHKVMAKRPKTLDVVRGLQGHYNERIRRGLETANESARRGEWGPTARRILDKAFFDELSRASVNGSRVSIGLFQQDPKVHGIYKEYLQKLNAIKDRAH